MIPVMANTNMNKSMIDFAGVDSGAKIFVRPVDEGVGLAAATVANQESMPIIKTADFSRERVGCEHCDLPSWGGGVTARRAVGVVRIAGACQECILAKLRHT